MFPVSTNGIIEEKVITLKHAVLVVADEGKLVKVTAENTVALAADGDLVFGVLTKVEKDVCAVMIEGVVTLPYTGTAPSLNYSALAANGPTGVKEDINEEIRYRVLAVDITNTKVTFILK